MANQPGIKHFSINILEEIADCIPAGSGVEEAVNRAQQSLSHCHFYTQFLNGIEFIHDPLLQSKIYPAGGSLHQGPYCR